MLLIRLTEKPHKFTNKLEGKNVVEDDKVEFKLETEDDDAEVKWFKDGVEVVPDGKRYVFAPSLSLMGWLQCTQKSALH